MSEHEHEHARELAAIALDFDLDAAERAELESHLATCDPCRTFVAALSGDSVALSALPAIDAPDKVRRAVLAGRPARSAGSARPLAAAAIVLVLALLPLGTGAFLLGGSGCGFCSPGDGGPMVTPAVAPATGAPTMAPPRPSPSPTVSPSPSPSSTAQPPATSGSST